MKSMRNPKTQLNPLPYALRSAAQIISFIDQYCRLIVFAFIALWINMIRNQISLGVVKADENAAFLFQTPAR